MSRLVSTCHPSRCQRPQMQPGKKALPERALTCGLEVQREVPAILAERQSALSDFLDHPSLVENGARIATLAIGGDDVRGFAKRDCLQIEFWVADRRPHLHSAAENVAAAIG